MPAHQILKVYKETLTVFTQVYCAGVLNSTSSSQGFVLEIGVRSGKAKWNPYSKDREEGEEPPITWGPAHRPTGIHIFYMTFPAVVRSLALVLVNFLFFKFN